MNFEEKGKTNIAFGELLKNKDLLQLMRRLYQVKTSTPMVQAKANATSMSDNNGKRIIYTLTEDMLQS